VGSITRPEIFVREAGNEWRIKARSAVVSADHEFVSLTGDVRMQRYNAVDSDRLEIDTRDLLVSVTPRIATTDAGITMRHAGDRLKATGMKLDMVANRYEMLNNVSAFYDTP
jgi:LPS export ABC transporter protein LptC